MKAADVMVSNVVSVGSQASVQEVADLLLRNRISGVPVIGPRATRVLDRPEARKKGVKRIHRNLPSMWRSS